jgi:K+-sensing histidine kinase KdpD
VVDSGVGITPDRQKLLFFPFKELRDKIGISKAQNDNVGLGLSCSKEICKHMGGDMRLKESKKGLTVFTFKIPVLLKVNGEHKNFIQ